MGTYLFLQPDAISFLNGHLHLPATGKEQDWEIELADQSRRGEFFNLLKSQSFKNEPDVELALASLFIASVDDAISAGAFSEEENTAVLEFFRSRPDLRKSLHQLWFGNGEPMNTEAIGAWLVADKP